MTQAIRLLAKDYESLTQKDITLLCAKDIEMPEMDGYTFDRFIVGPSSPGKAENRLFDMICHTLFSALILGVQMHLLDRIDKEDCTRWSFFASPGILHYG